MPFYTYLLHCSGGFFYTGHTDDLERRMAEHNSGLIPGFSRDHHPVKLVWSESFQTRAEALAIEARAKGWSRAKTLALIRGDWEEIRRLGKKGRASTGSAQTDVGDRSAPGWEPSLTPPPRPS